MLIDQSWLELIESELGKGYVHNLMARAISHEEQEGNIIYPPADLVFQAFNMTPVSKVKVVILGQDPYHKPGQAMGLSFSVARGISVPPSLRNVYKELARDVDVLIPGHGDLSHWADQGVLLLNSFLTVIQGQPGSHRKVGWGTMTDAVISLLSRELSHIVFMLWGNFARRKKALIDTARHLVLEAAHPSPLAGNRFANCSHFSKANKYLKRHEQEPIDWQLPS